MKSRVLGALCLTVLCVILTLGLWPFHAPKNEVTWLRGGNGLSFGHYGTVQSSSRLAMASPAGGDAGSIEVWVQPDRRTGATFLAFYESGSGSLLALEQSLSDLKLEAEFQNAEGRTIPQRAYVDDAFLLPLQEKRPVFVTVTYSRDGIKLYLDGALAEASAGFEVPRAALNGRIVVGDSPWQPDSFRGEIRGLAVYDVELADAQVFRHYLSWREDGHPDIAEGERNQALYLFDEQQGTVIHNRAAQNASLSIPETYSVADKLSLEPFWKEFNLSRSYWKSNLVNVVGFLPVGFVFFAYFTLARPVKNAALATLAVGAATSLTIEILQIFLPTRDSGTTDLITNTLGTYGGVLCYRNAWPLLVKRFPRLGRFLDRHGYPVYGSAA